MRRLQLEVFTDRSNRQVLDDLKSDGGHGNILSWEDDVVAPAYVAEPYPADAYFEAPPPGAQPQVIDLNASQQ